MIEPKVITVGPMPPEMQAYGLARYSRSADSISQSMRWVRERDSSQFLNDFYFQYGHASIADLGHVTLCFEGISELAATEIGDEQLWDGQARSSRYQDFSTSGFVVPPGIRDTDYGKRYREVCTYLLRMYQAVQTEMVNVNRQALPKPDGMSLDAYERTLKARSFDVARYLLFWGIPTGVGQVTSIRTLEKQMARLGTLPYAELHDLVQRVKVKLQQGPDVELYPDSRPVAPTFAKYLEPNKYQWCAHNQIETWAATCLPAWPADRGRQAVELTVPHDREADILSTFLYQVLNDSYSNLYACVSGWSPAQRKEAFKLITAERDKEETLREFRTQPYVFDLTMDIGAYRDLHRHRRVQHFRKRYSPEWGFAVPEGLPQRLVTDFLGAVQTAHDAFYGLPWPDAEYLLPFATRGRFLMKMDAAEVDYICRLRTGVKGHISYRKVAWAMLEEFRKVEPLLASYIKATPPTVKDDLTR